MSRLLSVIIPEADKRTQFMCKQQLKGLDYEIISTPGWNEGIKYASGEFVCLVESGSEISDGYFWDNLRIFTSQPSFRKLAMVSPEIAHKEWETTIFGYLLSTDGTKPSVLPSHVRSSSQPYAIQIGYIPGSIIRRVVAEHTILGDDMLFDSIRLSLSLWAAGSRCFINPDTTYIDSSERKIQFPTSYDGELPKEIKDLVQMFRREMVG